eukprot:6515811-Lingulodinium_polyedra.AAC.1
MECTDFENIFLYGIGLFGETPVPAEKNMSHADFKAWTLKHYINSGRVLEKFVPWGANRLELQMGRS